MSSLDPLPPATPPAQKPTRIIKPRPPTRPRPYLPPRPDSARLSRGPTPTLPSEISTAETLSKGCSRVTEPPYNQERHLHKLQNSGAVRKIVVRFDHAAPEKGEIGKPNQSTPNCNEAPVPVTENGRETTIEEKEGQDPSKDIQTPVSCEVEQNGVELPPSCPLGCPCICHQQRPGMVLAWVPAHSQKTEQEDGEDGPASDLSSSADEGGSFFQHILRITRIKMLLEIIEDCNSEVGRMRHMEELIHIASKIEFDKLKSRQLLKQGELLEVVHRGSIFGTKPKLVSERFVVLDYAHRSLVQAQGCGETHTGQGTDNSFYLTLMENHQGRSSDRLCRAPTQSDMHRWIGAFPSHESQPNNKQETIYEDWDCPQVQCTETYTATQADELSLEPTDIVNVLRKTNEGWYEGVRLTDGKKGWFPSRYVQEITNEHVRRRNLRERYRVLQAACQLQLTRTSHGKGKYGSA
ncbi:hypothetical protein JD844_001135 [Phrynosoma platyrhinos]|uniref:SH3 domain-containing protein n=1 Tax=Phrynosoma platyrhinos TaxID=52577 RepID=A0ABQ7T9Y1_PHRPL|nr:hypothetical protein JD844_001135 [Phrynosoma platyrhinos]